MFPAPVTRHPYCLTQTELLQQSRPTWSDLTLEYWSEKFSIWLVNDFGVQGKTIGHRVIGEPHPQTGGMWDKLPEHGREHKPMASSATLTFWALKGSQGWQLEEITAKRVMQGQSQPCNTCTNTTWKLQITPSAESHTPREGCLASPKFNHSSFGSCIQFAKSM